MLMNCKHNQHSYLLTIMFTALCLLLWMSCFFPVFADENDTYPKQVLMVVGFNGKDWHPYTLSLPQKNEIKRYDWQMIGAIVDPISVTRQPGTGIFFLKDNSGLLHRLTQAGQALSTLPGLADSRESTNYTQLRAYDDGLAMVQLIQGKSRDTQLIRYSEKQEKNKEQAVGFCEPLIKQASGQFHPLIVTDKNTKRQSLFYGHVSCRQACDPVIQEVWRQDLFTGQAKQLTLLNTTSYLHSVDESGRFGFISSNKRGYYHLARLNIESTELTWLTDGLVTDSYPSIAGNGDLYFIRRTPSGTMLMRMDDATKPSGHNKNNLSTTTIALPKGVQKIRYLELSAQ